MTSLLALALIASPMVSTITLEEARAMSASELANRVLGMTGDAIREVRIDSDQVYWPVDRGTVLKTIYLAGEPRRAGPPGLCAAKVYEVQFEPAGTPGADGRTPVTMVRMFYNDVYKVVSALSYPGGRIDDSTHIFRDEKICPTAGPVLWQPRTDRAGFFRGSFEGRYVLDRKEAWFIARALEGAQQWQGRINCSGSDGKPAPWLCNDPRPTMESGAFWNLSSYDITYCEDQPRTLCVIARFHPGPGLQIDLTIATTAADPQGFQPLRVRRVTLEAVE